MKILFEKFSCKNTIRVWAVVLIVALSCANPAFANIVFSADSFSVDYYFSYMAPGRAGGVITIKSDYTGTAELYWGKNGEKLPNYTKIATVDVKKTSPIEYTVQEFTAIPKEATQVLAYNGAAQLYAYGIPEARRADSGQPDFTFAALSDPHFGNRYDGAGEIPRQAFNKALNVISGKDVSLIAISGDITSGGSDSQLQEYQTAVNTFNGTCPNIPIYTITGNHDVNTVNSTWNTRTADSNNYTGPYQRVYYPGNTLDYTVQAGDKDIFVFLNQIRWEYGSSSSRLLDDSQVNWLKERVAENTDKQIYLFFHSYIKDTAGDVSNGLYRYDLPVLQESVEGKELLKLLKENKNISMFSGHSHWMYHLQSLYNPSQNSYNTSANIYDGNGQYGKMIHVSSVTEPRDLKAGSPSRTDMSGSASEGYFIDVYDDRVVIKGYDFFNNIYQAYAAYVFEKGDAQPVRNPEPKPEPGFEDIDVSGITIKSDQIKVLPSTNITLAAEIRDADGVLNYNAVWAVDAPAGKVNITREGVLTINEDAAPGNYIVTASFTGKQKVADRAIITVVAKDGITGAGTKADPYLIRNEYAFLQFSDNINMGTTYEGKYIKQTSNLDMANISGYTGTKSSSSYSFKGVYDGGGYEINVDLNSPGETRSILPRIDGNAVVMNLGTTGRIIGYDYVGGVVRSQQSSNALIINCWSTAFLKANKVGGITVTVRGKVINCIFAGDFVAPEGGGPMASDIPSGGEVKNSLYYSPGNTTYSNAAAAKITLAELTETAAATLNSTLANSAAYLPSGFSANDLLAWNQNGANHGPGLYAAYGVENVVLSGEALQSILIKTNEGSATAYLAIYHNNVLVGVKQYSISQAGSHIWETDTTMPENTNCKIFIWNGELSPCSNAFCL